MSRVGKKNIIIPSGVTLDITENKVTVNGPHGSLSKTIRNEVGIEIKDEILNVTLKENSRKANAYRGLTRALINNLVEGVSKGFEKKLVLEGVGYRVNSEPGSLTLTVGFSIPYVFKLPDGVKANIEKNEIVLKAIDKELLGLTAARIRAIRKPEPYKGKGIRYSDEHIIRKVGKAAGKK